jgi:uncharacterized membrane protein
MLAFGQTTVPASRVVDLETCLVLLTLMQTVYFTGLVLLAWRYGRPTTWPVPAVAVVVMAALASSFVWWWIDKVVEGDNLVEFSPKHSLTAGDLLAMPQLITAALIASAALIGLVRRRRANGRREPVAAEASAPH